MKYFIMIKRGRAVDILTFNKIRTRDIEYDMLVLRGANVTKGIIGNIVGAD